MQNCPVTRARGGWLAGPSPMQMFDGKELTTVFNEVYEGGVEDDMLALTYEANKNVTFAVKTQTGLTE